MKLSNEDLLLIMYGLTQAYQQITETMRASQGLTEQELHNLWLEQRGRLSTAATAWQQT